MKTAAYIIFGTALAAAIGFALYANHKRMQAEKLAAQTIAQTMPIVGIGTTPPMPNNLPIFVRDANAVSDTVVTPSRQYATK